MVQLEACKAGIKVRVEGNEARETEGNPPMKGLECQQKTLLDLCVRWEDIAKL